MSLIQSSDLSTALSEVRSKIREGLETAPLTELTPKTRKLISEAHGELSGIMERLGHSLEISKHGLRLSMGRYQMHGRCKPHIWGAFIPNEVKAASHVTPQLYIFRSDKVFGWGISPSHKAKDDPEFMTAYRVVFQKKKDEFSQFLEKGYFGLDHSSSEENQNYGVNSIITSDVPSLRRIIKTTDLPFSKTWEDVALADLQNFLPFFDSVVEVCRKAHVVDRTRPGFTGDDSDEEAEDVVTDNEPYWHSLWLKWFDGSDNNESQREVPKYLTNEVGLKWTNVRQRWDIGRRESINSIDDPSEDRVHALLFGSLQRTHFSGGWRNPLKENYAKVIVRINDFVKQNPTGCSNAAFEKLVSDIHSLTGFELKSFITRVMCDFQPSVYLPLGNFTVKALGAASAWLELQPSASTLSKDDYEGLCNEGRRLASSFPTSDKSTCVYIFDHFLSWIDKEYGCVMPKPPRAQWTASEPELDFKNHRFWKISCGRAGRYAPAHKDAGVISIGWGGLIDLSKFKNKDDCLAHFKEFDTNDYDKAYATQQCWAFSREIKDGDFIFGYGSGTILMVGKVVGGYEYKDVAAWTGGKYPQVVASHKHIRHVTWFNIEPVETANLSSDLKRKLERNQTIFELTEPEAKEILSKGGYSNTNLEPQPEYPEDNELISIDELVVNTAKPKEFFQAIERRLLETRQVIFYGPPGTSKTHIAQLFSQYFRNGRGQSVSVQFHPSYSYEDFIEGYRPTKDGFDILPGSCKAFCKKALGKPNERFVFLIDEINRGNLAQIFGELLFLLEYRDKEANLIYSKSPFTIPDNVFIIGTMNSADRSIALVDYALRRRFDFFELSADTKVLETYLNNNNCQISAKRVVELFTKVNNAVISELGKHYAVGHTYFMKPDMTEQKLREIWQYSVAPLLEEYFFNNARIIENLSFELLWSDQKNESNAA